MLTNRQPSCRERRRTVRVGRQPSATLEYVIEDAASEQAAYDLVAAMAPSTVTLPDTAVVYIATIDMDEEGPAATVRRAVVEYGGLGRVPQVNVELNGFDISTENVRKVWAEQHIATYAIGNGAVITTGMDGLLNVNDQTREAEGIDVPVPVKTFTVSKCQVMTTAISDQIFRLTAHVNDAAWRTYAAGEVLFLGAVGQQRSDGLWDVVYHFAAQPNETDLQAGNATTGLIQGIAKRGWESIWFRHAMAEVGTGASKALVPAVIAAYVDRPLKYGNLNLLGLLNTGV